MINKLFNTIANKLSKQIDSVLIVNISQNLRILNVKISPEPKISALGIIDLPSEKKEETIYESIRKFTEDNNIKHKNTIISLPLNSFQIRRINLPVMPEKELLEAIKLQAREELHFDTNQVVIDFKIIGKVVKEDGAKTFDILYAAAKKEVLVNFIKLLKPLELNLLSINSLPFGYANLSEKYFNTPKEDVVVLIHIDSDSCFLAIYKNNQLSFFRDLPISIRNIKTALSGAFISGQGRISFDSGEIEEILFKKGLFLSSSQVLALARPSLERLATEVKRSLAYYSSLSKENAISKIFISGPGKEIIGIDKFISDELNLNVDVSKLDETMGDLGLAVGFDKNINLLPAEYRHQKIEEIEKISLRMVSFAVVLIIIIFYIFTKAGIDAYKRRLENSYLHLSALSELKQTNEKAGILKDLIESIQTQKIDSGKILKLLSNKTPKEVIFRKFSLNQNTKSGIIEGYIKTKGENPEIILTGFMKDLEGSRVFSEIKVSSIDKAQQDGSDISNFVMVYKLSN